MILLLYISIQYLLTKKMRPSLFIVMQLVEYSCESHGIWK
jgi:hypothetical protein